MNDLLKSIKKAQLDAAEGALLEHLEAHGLVPKRGVDKPADVTPADSRVRPLTWTAERQPDAHCRYNHCIAETPIGRFLLTWKGWKSDCIPVADETPWGEFYDPGVDTVAEAQAACQREYVRRVTLCLAT